MRSWIRKLFTRPASVTIRTTSQPGRLDLEALEDRCCPSSVTVTNTNDIVNGDTSSIAALLADQGLDGISLREALLAASNTEGDDTIDFDSILFGTAQTITLGGTQLEVTDTTGSTTIMGLPGLTISGDGSSRVFQINEGVSASFSHLIITGGNATEGGGIWNAGDLTLTDCTIEGNTAGKGGGIWNGPTGTATLECCTVTGNHAVGGFVYNESEVLIDVTGLGGGLFNDGGTLTLIDSSVSENTADFAGGGVMNGSPGSGKGAASSATLTMIGCDIEGNTAGNGAGVWNSGTATLECCTVSGNHASGGFEFATVESAGGEKGSSTPVTRSDASGLGGGAFNSGTLTLENTNVRDNTADLAGGGVFNFGAPQGGSKGAAAPTTLNMINCDVSGNAAGVGSGVFNGGQTSTGSGKGAATSPSAVLNMSGTTDSDNEALPGGGSAGPAYAGAGFGVVNLGLATLSDCTISGNEGGGVFNSGALAVSAGGGKGSAGGGKGSATTTTSGAALTMTNTTVSGNVAPDGVGISVAEVAGFGVINMGTARLTNSTISGNERGGVYNNAGSAGAGKGSVGTVGLTMVNSTVSEHVSPAGGAVGLVNLGTATLVHTTISGNDGGIFGVAATGGGKGATTTTTTLVNSIVAGNTFADLSGTGFAGNNNLIGDHGSGGLVDEVNGNIVGVAAADLHLASLADNGGPTQTMALLAGSPAIDAATPVVLTTLAATIDDDTTTTITVASTANLVAGLYIQIDNEILLITEVTGVNTLEVVRGQLGTAAAAHNTTGVNVTLAADQTGVSYLDAPDIGAFEFLGTPVVTVTVAPASVLEDGAQPLIFTFTRAGASTRPLTISYQASGTATGFGPGTIDYTVSGGGKGSSFDGGPSGTGAGVLVFAAGAAEQSIFVYPTPDFTLEDDETVIITIGTGTNYTTGSPDSATGTILDDEPILSTSSKSVLDESGDDRAEPGEVLTYTIVVTNTGHGAAKNVSIADGAPANTTFVAGSARITADTTGGTVTNFNGDEPGETSLLVDIDSIIVGGSITITFEVTVDLAFAPDTIISNSAQVSATGVPEFDTNSADIETTRADHFDTTLWADFFTNSGWSTQVVGDFNGDGRDDIANFHPGTGSWYVSIANDTGDGFVTTLWADFFTNSGWTAQVVGDFNGDGYDDIANFHPMTGNWWVSISNDTHDGFVTTLWADFFTNSGWTSQVVGDFNGDGYDDIANFNSATGSWWVSISNDTHDGFVTTLWADF
ncbi:MAG: beta strand repeat-containing protein, partial [Gemmataceae bacterium]